MEEFNILNRHFDEIIKDKTTAEQLINGLEARQRETMKDLPRYGKLTLYFAIVILVVGLLVQALTGSIPNDQLQLFQSLKSPTIGGILSVFFTVVAYLVNALFAVWAVSFIPYIAIRAYKVSQKVKIPLRLNSSKWIQLFAATFLPIIAFAIFATNIPGNNASSLVIKFTYMDGIYIVGGGALCWLILYGATHFIPLKYIVIHLTIFSSLLYAVIFSAYILGFGTITYAAVLGMIAFLMFSSSMLGEIARRVSIYDLDSNITDKVSNVSNRENLIKLKEAETDVSKLENELESKVQKIDSEVQINEQLRKIRTTRIEFNAKVNETKLDSFNKKLDFLNQIYTVLADEYKLKVDQELPTMIGAFKQNVKNMTPEELSETMNGIIKQVNSSLDTIPQGLDNLKIEMRKATKELKQATDDLATDND